MPTWGASFAAVVAALTEHYGLPESVAAAGSEPLRALVSVLLARATDERKAARGLTALSDAGLLDPRELAKADRAEIDDALRSSGVSLPPRVIAPLQRLARWIAERYTDENGNARGLEAAATESLRAELAALKGIGPATADALLLQALGRPVYPVDRATYRILIRHAWLDTSAGYDEARALVEGPATDDAATLGRLSSGLVRVGRDFCRVQAARCDRCPLRELLPEGGPVDPRMEQADESWDQEV
jgi:endonuclease-3 related protein